MRVQAMRCDGKQAVNRTLQKESSVTRNGLAPSLRRLNERTIEGLGGLVRALLQLLVVARLLDEVEDLDGHLAI